MDGQVKKPIKQSRWVAKSAVPRYDKRALEHIMDTYVEAPDWVHGARVVIQHTNSKGAS